MRFLAPCNRAAVSRCFCLFPQTTWSRHPRHRRQSSVLLSVFTVRLPFPQLLGVPLAPFSHFTETSLIYLCPFQAPLADSGSGVSSAASEHHAAPSHWTADQLTVY